jgi:hypothetical protein
MGKNRCSKLEWAEKEGRNSNAQKIDARKSNESKSVDHSGHDIFEFQLFPKFFHVFFEFFLKIAKTIHIRCGFRLCKKSGEHSGH